MSGLAMFGDLHPVLRVEGVMPWPVFAAVWGMILAAALAWTAGPWGILRVLLPPVLASIALGNIDILMATAIVAGFRYPAGWAFVLLTKVTPGVGLVWSVVRREWRSLAIALGAAIVAWGARTDRRWIVPVAAAIAIPGSRSRDDRLRGRA